MENNNVVDNLSKLIEKKEIVFKNYLTPEKLLRTTKSTKYLNNNHREKIITLHVVGGATTYM